MKRFHLLVALSMIALATQASADGRSFAFTYEPKTMPAGEVELEYYMTSSVRYDWLAKRHDYGWNHQVELEYGITDRLDVAMYQVFSADAWNGFKLRTRYRPFDYGAKLVDVMLYGEVIMNRAGEVAFEEKLVVGRRFGDLVLTLDSTIEQEAVFSGTVAHQWNEAIGAGYELTPWVTLGLEAQARMGWEPRQVYTSGSTQLEFKDPVFYAGPTVSLKTKKFFWNANLSFRANDEDQEAKYLFRVIWGIPL